LAFRPAATRIAAVKRRRHLPGARLARALLVSLALVVVITPPVGAALLREASALMAGPAGGCPPTVLKTVLHVVSVRLSTRGNTTPFALRLPPKLAGFPTVFLVRDILLITNRTLC
jgi:hypothetical protein